MAVGKGYRAVQKLPDYFGRLFIDQQAAEAWGDRMRRKLGAGFSFAVLDGFNFEGTGDLVLGYVYKLEV